MGYIEHEFSDLLFSIVIPVFNTEKYLRRCIDSVLAQTYFNIEIILIDDGSTDSSGEICDFYAAIDKRIKVFHQNNKGVSVARNNGISNASGEYILFVDSDDWLELDMLETMLINVNRTKHQLIACNAFRDNDSTKKIMDEEIEQDEILNFEELGRCDKRGTSIMNGPWGKLYNLKLIKENGLKFNEQISFGEDKLFVFSYTKLVEETVCIAKPYYHYFCREDSVMNEELSEKHFQMFQVYKILLSSFNETSERYEIIRQACIRLVVWFRHKCKDKKKPFWEYLDKIEISLIKDRKLPELEWEKENENRTNGS